MSDSSALVPPIVLKQVEHALSCCASGSEATVERELTAIADRCRPDELIVMGMMHDQAARLRSFDMVMGVSKRLCA